MADSITLIPSKLTFYRRTRSGKWQCRYKLKNGDWYRESTKESDLNEAKDIAFRRYYSAEERVKNNLPQNTRNFKFGAFWNHQNGIEGHEDWPERLEASVKKPSSHWQIKILSVC